MENLLGKEGSGTAIFNETMIWERCCLFACHIGAMERILKQCVQYIKQRKQFKQPIGKFQAIAHKIADIKVNLELGKLMLQKVGWMKTQKQNVVLESSIAKLFVSESLKTATLAAVQIHGSYGYMAEMGIEKELRDAVAATIYSGTSEIQRNIISRYMGL
jgi:alkylation response protein AidB-like acyl-CoA dehydrogenase